MINTDYQAKYFEEFIGDYAKIKQKAVVYLRSYGWNNSTDIDKINQSMEIYKSILPLDLFTALHQSEMIFVEIDDIKEAMNFFDDVLPEDQASCELEQYIHYSIYNSQGQIIANN
jgi:hypothetical protein